MKLGQVSLVFSVLKNTWHDFLSIDPKLVL